MDRMLSSGTNLELLSFPAGVEIPYAGEVPLPPAPRTGAVRVRPGGRMQGSAMIRIRKELEHGHRDV